VQNFHPKVRSHLIFSTIMIQHISVAFYLSLKSRALSSLRLHRYETRSECFTGCLQQPAQNTSSRIFRTILTEVFHGLCGRFMRNKALNSMLECANSFCKFVWLVLVKKTTSLATIKGLTDEYFPPFQFRALSSQTMLSVSFLKYLYSFVSGSVLKILLLLLTIGKIHISRG
jgi:hypothetical protein